MSSSDEKHPRFHRRQAPMERVMVALAHQLKYVLMYIKSREQFPERVIYDAADTILYWLGEDRKALLYALSFLNSESDWVRHAIRVSVQTGDMLLLRNKYATQTREIVVGALLHTMGKPLLVGKALPSLKNPMTDPQKELLKQHVHCLRDTLASLSWTPSPACEDILLHANERLDGTGYPQGLRGYELSDPVVLISVIKAVNKLSFGRNDARSKTPLQAYRLISDTPQRYDKATLVEYIQCYGFYPIGSLARFSRGFLAWIQDTDSKGSPVAVKVVKNLAFVDTNINSVLKQSDFSQIGDIEGVLDPTDYGITLLKK